MKAICLLDVELPMRDGVNLIGTVYLPVGEGPFPVILSRSPYGATTSSDGRDAYSQIYTGRGVAFVYVDTRGRFKSGGECRPCESERDDGYDTLEWIASQAWCNGRIAMIGGSYVAVTQLMAMASGHPALKAIAPSAISANLYHMFFCNGVYQLAFVTGWYFGMHLSRNPAPEGALPWDEIFRKHDLLHYDEYAKIPFESWRKLISSPDPDSGVWPALHLSHYAEQIRIPCLIQTSYFDVIGRGGLALYTELMNHPAVSDAFKKNSFLRIGPWGHGVNVHEGERDYGPDALVTEELEIASMVQCLSGETPDMARLPGRIQYFTMGENKWHYANTWPVPGVRAVSLFLGADFAANTARGGGFLSWNEPVAALDSDCFFYDPENPVPTCGGRVCGAGGQKDQTEVEARTDVLVYTTEPLDEDLTVTGTVSIRFFAASSAPDTDFTVKLVEVDEQGVPWNLCDSVIRARWRDGFDRPRFLVPDLPAEFMLDVDWTSYRFKRGRRIRLEISSSNYPMFAPNPNTGGDLLTGTDSVVARQTLFHSPEYPSAVILPVVDNA